MTDRRDEILDAALHVLAEQGMRGLTHRAVDAAAGIAQGSTSYYFRSRSALVDGCVHRLVALDRAVEVPAVAGNLLDVLVGVTVAFATTQRHRTLARYELSLAAVRDPGLRSVLVEGGDAVRALAAAALAPLGVAEPAVAAAELAAVIDGLVFTAMVRGPHEPAALAARARPVLDHALAAHLP